MNRFYRKGVEDALSIIIEECQKIADEFGDKVKEPKKPEDKENLSSDIDKMLYLMTISNKIGNLINPKIPH